MSFRHRLVTGVAVAVIAVLATVSPASAHDQLLDSTPAVDERLDSAPESITMRFTGQLLTLGDSSAGAIVLVVDEAGRDWATGEVEVVGDTVTAGVDSGMPDAGYQVRWQVVSEDGHTIAGVVPFVIGDGESFAVGSGVTPNDLSAGDTGVQAQATQESDDALRIVLIGAGGAAAAVAAFALLSLFRRRRATAPVSAAETDDRKTTS